MSPKKKKQFKRNGGISDETEEKAFASVLAE